MREKKDYSLCSGLYSVLWAMSLVEMQSFTLGSFLWFTIFLLGGGLAYHFLTEMLRTPINSGNDTHWNASLKYALLSALMVFSVAAVALFEKFIYTFHGLLTLACLFLAIFAVPYFADKGIKSFSRIAP